MMGRKFRTVFGAAALAMTVACSSGDPGITTAVKGKLAADDTVKAYRIDVDTKGSVVTLKGDVDTAAARTRALELARGTEGVTDVVDQLNVTPGATPPGGVDDAAAGATREAARDADAKTDAAQRKAGDNSREAKRDADDKTDAAQRKAGDSTDRAGDATGNAALTAKVKTKFLADDSISGLKIDVDSNNGVVTLTGTVATAAEKALAVKVARGTDGVKSVVDRLKVGK